MKKFFTTIKNIFSIEDLRIRILNTIGFLIIFRLGSYVVLPGIDPEILEQVGGQAQGIFGLLNTFLGGAFSRASIFALGIMPYISASIVMQLMQVAVPYFQKMQKEGESGRNRMNQITRVLTIAITLAQSIGYLATTVPAEAIVIDPYLFRVSSMIILVSGTMFVMWLGERITDKGIGNGISMLIMIGIISRLPFELVAEITVRGMSGALVLVLELVAFLLICSPTKRTPLPLYGSTFLIDLIFAATSPINCLSIPSRITCGLLPFGLSAVTVISEGTCRKIL
jgi:preprotein translocase subunit SecY